MKCGYCKEEVLGPSQSPNGGFTCIRGHFVCFTCHTRHAKCPLCVEYPFENETTPSDATGALESSDGESTGDAAASTATDAASTPTDAASTPTDAAEPDSADADMEYVGTEEVAPIEPQGSTDPMTRMLSDILGDMGEMGEAGERLRPCQRSLIYSILRADLAESLQDGHFHNSELPVVPMPAILRPTAPPPPVVQLKCSEYPELAIPFRALEGYPLHLPQVLKHWVNHEYLPKMVRRQSQELSSEVDFLKTVLESSRNQSAGLTYNVAVKVTYSEKRLRQLKETGRMILQGVDVRLETTKWSGPLAAAVDCKLMFKKFPYGLKLNGKKVLQLNVAPHNPAENRADAASGADNTAQGPLGAEPADSDNRVRPILITIVPPLHASQFEAPPQTGGNGSAE